MESAHDRVEGTVVGQAAGVPGDVDDPSVAALVATAWLAGYSVAAWLRPFTNCRKCHGDGKLRSPSGRNWRRCKRCGGTGRRRLGRQLLNHVSSSAREGPARSTSLAPRRTTGRLQPSGAVPYPGAEQYRDGNGPDSSHGSGPFPFRRSARPRSVRYAVPFPVALPFPFPAPKDRPQFPEREPGSGHRPPSAARQAHRQRPVGVRAQGSPVVSALGHGVVAKVPTRVPLRAEVSFSSRSLDPSAPNAGNCGSTVFVEEAAPTNRRRCCI
jgi:hypothetical protein